jgi:hypothetical protein
MLSPSVYRKAKFKENATIPEITEEFKRKESLLKNLPFPLLS